MKKACRDAFCLLLSLQLLFIYFFHPTIPTYFFNLFNTCLCSFFMIQFLLYTIAFEGHGQSAMSYRVSKIIWQLSSIWLAMCVSK